MPNLNEYTWMPETGGYIRKTDGAGPFTLESESSAADIWTQAKSGYWFKQDGSGPYSRNIDTGTATAVYPTPTGSVTISAALSPYVMAVTASGGTLTTDQTSALQTFIERAQQAGYWSKLEEVAPFLGGFSGCLFKLKYKGLPALINSGFVAADYSSSLGLTNTTNKYLDWATHFNDVSPSSASNIGGAAVFVSAVGSNASASAVNVLGGQNGGNPQVFIRVQVTDTRVDAAYAGLGQNPNTTALQRTPATLYHVERNSAASLTLYLGGVQSAVNTSSITPGSYATPLRLFASSDGTLNFLGSIGFAALTDGTMTAEECRLFAEHVGQLMRALQRPATSTRVPRYIPVIGQSLARGSNGTPLVQPGNAYNNLMPAGGMLGGNPANSRPTVWNSASAGVYVGGLVPMAAHTNQTISETFSETVSLNARNAGLGDAWDAVHANWAIGATAYSGLRKGTAAYINSIAAARYIRSAMAQHTSAAPDLFDVPAILCVHGESDAASGTYQTDIRTWQSDYSADFAPLTGRASVPIFHSQTSNWTESGAGGLTTVSAACLAMLAEHEMNPSKSVLVCPKYFLEHAADGIHLTGPSYAKLGEYYGKAFYKHVVQGVQFEPLRPGTITRVGAVVTIPLRGCIGAVVLDTVGVTNPGNYGFTVSGGGVAISSVAVSGADGTAAVVITLNGVPGGAVTIGYAATGVVGDNGGPTTGPRGCVRDSDTFVGSQGATLPNWLVHFSKSVA